MGRIKSPEISLCTIEIQDLPFCTESNRSASRVYAKRFGFSFEHRPRRSGTAFAPSEDSYSELSFVVDALGASP